VDLFSVQLMAFIGILCGVLARSALPYLRKNIKENIPLSWEHRYTALFLVGVVASFLVYPRFQIPPDGFDVFVAAFVFGFGVDALVLEGWAWIEPEEEEEEEEHE